MKRLYALVVTAALCFPSIGAWAWWQSIQQVAIVAGGGGYTGPGDLGLSATVKVFASAGRCYNTAYSGNVAEIWDSATGSTTKTVLTCSAGGTINETVNSLNTTCGTGTNNCVVKILYDQSGANACGGSPCNYTADSTFGTWPPLARNYSNGKNCIANSTLGASMTTPAITTLVQQFSASAVYFRIQNASTAFAMVAGGANPNAGIIPSTAANTVIIFAGSAPPTTAADSVLHSVQGVFNGASSVAYVDTTASSVSSGAGTLSGDTLRLFGWSGPTAMVDNLTLCESSLWSGGFSVGDYTALGANQHGANGYSF